MIRFDKNPIISIIGAGAMGSGIGQVAASFGHKTIIFDINQDIIDKAKSKLFISLNKLEEKGKITEEKSTLIKNNLFFTTNLEDVKESSLVIEAIVENLDIKHNVLRNIENLVSENCILQQILHHSLLLPFLKFLVLKLAF